MGADITEDTRPPPTFQGRLQLESFMFKAGFATAGLRRSPRLSSASSSSSAAALPVPPPRRASRSPSKRKADPPDEDDLKEEDTSSPSTTPAATSTTITISATATATATATVTVTRSPSRNNRSKRARVPSTYAPPSAYAHLPGLPDALAPNLLVLFVGLNPGVETARTGHAYAHPTNLFWRLLHSSGVTPRLCAPAEDRQLPARYALGLTNIVARPSRNGAELSRAEMDAGVAVLEAKIRRWRPEAVCLVGKSIWESVWRVRHGRPIRPAEFRYGWQDERENMGQEEEEEEKEKEKEEGVVYDPDWKGARVFVATSTSGLAATLKPKEKEEIWKELGDWVVKRRAERAAAGDSV
ncbi:uracil-DNA glycosylase-like protein, partial [Thermothelomyces heterothallicus CBS 202.75]|uniref:uracil-DNA glycosylase-like protein n=1 Tax=Thermothelomyces heterothallicus CBS 202.75 TaxID=1149848 RepID=UPI003744286B